MLDICTSFLYQLLETIDLIFLIKNVSFADSCKKSSVSLKSVIASVELIRCDRVTIICEGAVPLINLENSESVQIFLSVKSRDVEIVSAKCSSCNICLLEEDGTYVRMIAN